MPFAKFSQMTGRLMKSSRLLPLNPIPPVPLQNSEVPQIMFDTLKTKPVKTAAASAAAGKPDPTVGRIHPRNEAFMKKLQADLEAPVYLAKGTPDKILFYITVALITGCTFESMRFIWMRATQRI